LGCIFQAHDQEMMHCFVTHLACWELWGIDVSDPVQMLVQGYVSW